MKWRSSGVRSLLKLAVDAWAVAFTTKMGLFMVLHVLHMRGRGTGDHQQQDHIYRLMYHLGASYRDLGGLGVIFYACLFYLSAVFVFVSRLCVGHFVDLNKHGMVMFVMDPGKSKQSVAQSLRNNIGLLIHSNSNCQQVLRDDLDFHRGPKSSVLSHRSVPSYLGRAELRALERQQAYLMDRSLVGGRHLWPINRRPEWRASLASYLLFVYKFLLVFFTLTSILIQALTHWLAHSASLANKLKQGADNKLLLGWNMLDRLLCLEQSAYLLLLMDWISYPIAVIVLNILDSLSHLRHIRTRIRQLLLKAKRARRSSRGSFSAAKAGGRHRFECDQDALDLYVQFNMFTEDLNESLKLANLYLSLFNTSLFLSFLTTMLVIKDVNRDELKLISVLCLIGTMVADGFLLVAAAFNAECSRTIRLTWPLLAAVRGAHSDLAGAHDSAELVTLHTLTLWQRHNQDQAQIMSRYSFMVYGFLRSDYATILRLNFWLVSLIILVLTTNTGKF